MNDNLNWYVARVRSCQERKTAERLAARGIEVYVPVQKVRHKWSDRIKTIDKLLIPGLVFIHCDRTTKERTYDMVSGLRYIADKSKPGRESLFVPDRQMEDFMLVVKALGGEDDIQVVEYNIAPGDMVRVVRGPLEGFVCECVEVQQKHKLVVRLGMLGSVVVNIDAADVVKE